MGNLGCLTWVRPQQPQEQHYPTLLVCHVLAFACCDAIEVSKMLPQPTGKPLNLFDFQLPIYLLPKVHRLKCIPSSLNGLGTLPPLCPGTETSIFTRKPKQTMGRRGGGGQKRMKLGEKKKKHSIFFFFWLFVESSENTTMRAAVLCPAVCISDVMKARMCSKSTLTSHPFCAHY